jgi:sugar phosphate isomerase/epimerase
VWWDPGLSAQIARAGAEGRLAGYQVADMMVPLAEDALLSRAMMGDGPVDFASIGRWVTAAGYAGDVEVEIFNAAVWAADGAEVVTRMVDRYVRFVLPGLLGGDGTARDTADRPVTGDAVRTGDDSTLIPG